MTMQPSVIVISRVRKLKRIQLRGLGRGSLCDASPVIRVHSRGGRSHRQSASHIVHGEWLSYWLALIRCAPVSRDRSMLNRRDFLGAAGVGVTLVPGLLSTEASGAQARRKR